MRSPTTHSPRALRGEQAAGLQVLYQKGSNFAQIVALEHGGALYVVEWVADLSAVQRSTLNEILRTWTWVDGVDAPAPSAAASPSAVPTPTPAASAAGDEFPNSKEAKVLAHVPSAIADLCMRVDTIYDNEIDSVHCEPDGKPQTDYTLFKTAAAMNDAFATDMASFGNPTASAKGCLGGRYQNTYSVRGTTNGRWACVVDSKKNKVVEWTDDTNLILSYAWSPTLSWQVMHDYWQNEAGPID